MSFNDQFLDNEVKHAQTYNKGVVRNVLEVILPAQLNIEQPKQD